MTHHVKTWRRILGETLVLGGVACLASAQPPGEGPGRPGGEPRGPGAFLMRMPIIAALDANRDGEISTQEMENAVAALKGLDKDKNGTLSAEELRPDFGGPGGGGFGGGAGFGGGFGGRGGPPGGFGGGRPDGGAGPTAEERVARLMELDGNKDGKLGKDELSERMQGLMTRADADKDGFATKEELLDLARREESAARDGGPDGGRGGFGRPGGGPPEGAGRFGGGREGERGGFGPPSPEAFVARAMQFDADKDGKLDARELGAMAAQMGRGPGGPRGEGDRPAAEGRGDGERRRDGDRPAAEGRGDGERRRDGDRPERPRRPDSE